MVPIFLIFELPQDKFCETVWEVVILKAVKTLIPPQKWCNEHSTNNLESSVGYQYEPMHFQMEARVSPMYSM